MTLIRSIAALALLALSACAGGHDIAVTPSAPTPAERAYSYAPERVASGVHVLSIGEGFHIQPRGNVEVIEQSRGFVVVDGGGSTAGAEEVIAFIRSQSNKPVTAIVITHWHGDHALGVSRLIQEWPAARVIATASTRDMLASADSDRYMPGESLEANARYMENQRGNLDYLRQVSQGQNLSESDSAGWSQAAREYEQFVTEMANSHRVTPTEVVDERLLLADRERPVEVMFLGRANTAGDAVVWLPRQRVVITGDVVVAPIPFGFNAYPGEWIEVLDRIRSMNFAVLVPGHGPPMHDTAYIDRLSAMLTDVRRQVAPLAATDRDAAAATGQVNLEADERAMVGDDAWLQRWFRNYWKDPIISSALREARGQPIAQGES